MLYKSAFEKMRAKRNFALCSPDVRMRIKMRLQLLRHRYEEKLIVLSVYMFQGVVERRFGVFAAVDSDEPSLCHLLFNTAALELLLTSAPLTLAENSRIFRA